MRVGKDGVNRGAVPRVFSRCPGGAAAQNSAMRIFMSWLGALVLAVAAQAQDFTRTMTADERAAAGLEKLSPEELAKLKAAVERYKSGAVAVVQEQAEKKVAATEAKAKALEAKAAAEDKKNPGWVSALVTLSRIAAKPEKVQALESRLVGEFSGWETRTIFKLENGQIWQQDGGRPYYGDKVMAPAVKIYPGSNNAYFMEIEGVSVHVKVKPIKLE